MSSINPNNINGQYPIAGQDNDSQGFRDNFTNVKNNLTFAKTEIEDLQNNAILKSALSGTTLNNNLNYAQISAAQLIKSVETKNDLGTKTGAFSISWADGNLQYFTTSGNVDLTFTNWPTTGLYAKLVLQITTDTTNRTVTFPSAVSVNLSTIQGVSGQVVTLPTAGVYLFELNTYDAGTTIVIQDLLRNYNTSTLTTLTANTATVSGNLTIGGAVRTTGYQYANVLTNFAETINANVSRYIIEPYLGTVIANGSITLPNANVNATTITISAIYGITACNVKPNTGTILKPFGNITLANGSSATYFYNSTATAWYKIG
jgi:hypothetical protein